MDVDAVEQQFEYFLKVEELFKNVNKTDEINDKIKFFEEFTNKFTAIPRIWREWLRIINANQSMENQNQNKVIMWTKAISHFHSRAFLDDIYQLTSNFEKKDLIWSKNFIRQVQWGCKGVKPLLYYLQFVKKSFYLPNNKLESYLKFYEEFSTTPVPLEIYRVCQNKREQIGKIFRYLPYQKEWMLYMKKLGDDKFIIQNIESELSIERFDKRIWVVYIEFLKEKSHWKWLLNIYSRYCRFFTTDLEMRKQYKSEIERIQNLNFDVKKWKIDLIKIGKDFECLEVALKLTKEYFGKEIYGKENLEAELNVMNESNVEILTIPDYAIDETGFSPFRTTKAMPFQLKENQMLAFPSTVIYSILQKAHPIQLQKLHSTSKQLFSMTNIPICHRLEINEFETTVSFEQSLFVSLNDIQIGNAKKLYLTNSLLINSKNMNLNLLTEFIPKIYKCTVRFLKLQQLNIKIDHFNSLIQNVEKFTFIQSAIISNEEALSVTEIIDRMPKVSHVEFFTNGTLNFDNPPSQFQNHCEKLTKIKYLNIHKIQEVEDPFKICTFISKNAAPNSHFFIQLNSTQEYVQHLDNLIKIEFNKWLPPNENPCIIIQNYLYIM